MITKNIENLCQERGITISGLEKILRFGRGTIGKWTRCSPTVERLAAVADYFGVTVDELLREE